MKRAYIDLSHGQMHYRHAGSGDDFIIMLHMSGSSSDEYDVTGNILSEKYNVYAVDMFGFGNSDRSEHYLSFVEHRDSIIEFMDAMGIQKARFVGNLVGSNISVHLAAAYPDRVRAIALFHPCYNPDPEYFKRSRFGPVFAPIPLADDGSHLKEVWARSAKYGESKEATDARAVCLHKAGDWGEALHWALCEDEDFDGTLRRVTVPARAFGYEKSSHKNVELGSKLMEKGEYEFLPNASPYFFRATPELAAEKLLEFFGRT